ncbi:RNA cap guanine-N2 methyltransferase [Tanacetum coccineum]
MENYFEGINKYWFEKYLLFSKYDADIKMDKEGWFSATPECIAEHHASRCGKGVVVDCFTGLNAIRSTHVIAIDIDPKKIEYAKHNAAIYGVEDNIDFITGDSFVLAKNLKLQQDGLQEFLISDNEP